MIITSLIVSAGIIIVALIVMIHIINHAMVLNDAAQRNLVESEVLNKELQNLIKALPKEHRESSRHTRTDN